MTVHACSSNPDRLSRQSGQGARGGQSWQQSPTPHPTPPQSTLQRSHGRAAAARLTSWQGRLARLRAMYWSLQASMVDPAMPSQHHGWQSTSWIEGRWLGSAARGRHGDSRSQTAGRLQAAAAGKGPACVIPAGASPRRPLPAARAAPPAHACPPGVSMRHSRSAAGPDRPGGRR